MTDSGLNPTEIATESQQFSWGWFLFSAKGRISRSDYWLRFVVPYSVILIVLTILDVMMGMGAQGAFGVLASIFSILFLYSSIVVMIKRWHDRNKSGWWTLIIFVPIIGSIWFFIEAGCMEGTRGSNRFGPSRFPSDQNIGQVFE